MESVSWYVLACKASREEAIAAELAADGLAESLVPMVTSKLRTGRGSNRKTRKVTSPLFAGYVFAKLRLTREAYHLVKAIDGVRLFLRSPGATEPSPIPAGWIGAIKSETPLQGAPGPGDTVKIIGGPFHVDFGQAARVLRTNPNGQVQIELVGGLKLWIKSRDVVLTNGSE